MPATIGIKIANGDFYSIMEENVAVKKRLVLTTVHNNQKSVQIDLYKSYAKSMADALYIGSLVMDMTPKAKGEPSIELTISSDAEGVITAESADMGNPSLEHQQLSLHLKSFEEDTGDYSDFDVEESGSSLYQKAEAIRDEEPERKAPWGIIILIGVVLILILLGLWFFLFRTKGPREAGTSVVNEQSLAVGKTCRDPNLPAGNKSA
jgi:molecular chaperone DnaK (HSP70)